MEGNQYCKIFGIAWDSGVSNVVSSGAEFFDTIAGGFLSNFYMSIQRVISGEKSCNNSAFSFQVVTRPSAILRGRKSVLQKFLQTFFASSQKDLLTLEQEHCLLYHC